MAGLLILGGMAMSGLVGFVTGIAIPV